MKLKVDIDNCLRDCATPMVELYNETFGTKITKEDIIDYDMDISFPLLKENGIDAFKFFFIDNMNRTLINAIPTPGAAESMKRLHDLGHELVIVSYQPNIPAKLHTLEWLERNNIIYDSITFTNSPSKKIVKCDMIIDDHMKYLDEAPKTTVKVCIDYAYNRSKTYDFRFKNFTDFVNHLFN